MTNIGLEQGLDYLKPYLERNGCRVTSMEDSTDRCDCLVISGEDKDMMGIQKTSTNVPVINANGMNEAEVYEQVQQRVRS